MPKKDKAIIKKSAPARKSVRPSTTSKKKEAVTKSSPAPKKKEVTKPKVIPSLALKPRVQTTEGWIRSLKKVKKVKKG